MRVVTRNQQVFLLDQEDRPLPEKHISIRTKYSVISPGTELSMIRASKDQEIEIGYSAVGVVEACGKEVEEFKEGDVVSCYGAPYVKHASILQVPVTLCAKVPKEVEVKAASLGGIGAIAIHALRQAELQFGESVLIVGLGLLGQLIAQIGEAAAYDVIGYDLDQERTQLLKNISNIVTATNLQTLENIIDDQTKGNGVDAVLLCTGGQDKELPKKSLQWIRDRGKVVIVGTTEPHFPRELMFAKEADIRISRAGGPGRYDEVYEGKAVDYPLGYVRWTEGRNVGEFLRLLKKEKINVQEMIKNEASIQEAPRVYERLESSQTKVLTKIFKYE